MSLIPPGIFIGMRDEGKRSLIFAHAVAGDTADSINMLSVGPLYLHLNPKVVCSTRRWYDINKRIQVERLFESTGPPWLEALGPLASRPNLTH